LTGACAAEFHEEAGGNHAVGANGLAKVTQTAFEGKILTPVIGGSALAGKEPGAAIFVEKGTGLQAQAALNTFIFNFRNPIQQLIHSFHKGVGNGTEIRGFPNGREAAWRVSSQ
jgi:hypothetical protein